MWRWIVRRRGRAPVEGSMPALSRAAIHLGVAIDAALRQPAFGQRRVDVAEQNVDDRP